MSEKITVIHHSADFDGLFCREIARKFLPDAVLIGWDFGDAPLPMPEGRIYVLDLPCDRIFGFNFAKANEEQCVQEYNLKVRVNDGRVIWIDHHQSSINSHPKNIPGYRIDGVAACRLAWQWFTHQPPERNKCSFCGQYSHSHPVRYEQGTECEHCKGTHYGSAFCPYTEDVPPSGPLPFKEEYINRTVVEPFAVRLAGEYDIWDKRDANADVFQFGLRSKELTDWDWKQLLDNTVEPLQGTGMESTTSELFCTHLLHNGALLQRYQQQTDASVVKHRSFQVVFEEMDFLCLNTPRCNSLTFAELDKPETGHSGLLAFFWDGKQWKVSLYHASHRKDIDLSQIAVKYGGGGHLGACGFQTKTLPFLNG